MFFFLSKTLNIFTMPVVIIVGLLLSSMLFRSPRRKFLFLRLGVILLLFCCNDFIGNEFIKLWEVPATPFADIKKKYEWGIILSGVTHADMETHDRVYFQRGADRVTHTFQLYKMGIIKKIFISGGSGAKIAHAHREASEIASVLLMFGVRPQDLVIDNLSMNTHDSAVETKFLLGSITKPENCLLITSAFHMRRSLACFAKVGWPIDTFSTDFLSHTRKYTIDVLLVPKVDALLLWHVLTKEWAGFAAYKVMGYI